MSDYDDDWDFDQPLFNQPVIVERASSVETTEQPPENTMIQGAIVTALQIAGDDGLSTFEVEQRWHRGQAIIHTLRNQGYVIDTERSRYFYVGFNPDMKQVTKRMQDLYYETPHWKHAALERKKLDGFLCRQCRSNDKLETHHWRYRLFSESVQFDLITFCRPCHRGIHEAIKGGACHFPKQVVAEIAERILGS